MPRSDSRQRILDAAERLFAQKGMQATSLRDIGAAARANTGSIYFHFRTKTDLVREVFARRMAPLDAERFARLARCEAEAAPGVPSLEAVLDALIAPMLGLSRGASRGGGDFLKVLVRIYAEPDPEVVRQLEVDHGATLDRFRRALARALPELPEEQVLLRLHFALGSVTYTMGSDLTWQLLSGRRPRARSPEKVMSELMPFLVAGFRAPGADDPGGAWSWSRGAA